MRITIGRQRSLRHNRRGVSNVIVVVLSLVIIVVIVSNVILWSYQMNQLDWEKMREDMKITNVVGATNSSWFVTQSEYTTNVGSRISGTYTDTQAIDSVYERFSEETALGPSYYPSGYNMLGSTKYVSGSLSDLQSNNQIYMRFRSYVSATSSSTQTNAYVAYRSNTGTYLLNSPKERFWNGTAWSNPETEMATVGSPVRFVRVAYSPVSDRYYERTVVTLSDDGNLDAYVWTGSSWSVTNNIASVGTTANAYRPFDVEYEKTSGRALLVYFTNAASEIGYKIWNGTAWSGQSTYDLVPATSVNVYWINLAQNPISGSNELALVCIGATNSKAYALIWNGSSWVDQRNLTQSSTITATTTEDVAVAYEQSNGYAHFAYSTGNDAHVVRRTGTATYTDYTVDLTSTISPTLFSMKADPASNRVMLMSLDVNKKLNTADWSGTTWTTHAIHDQSTDYDVYRDADIAWEPSGSKVLMVWGTAAGALQYKTWTPGSGWSGESSITMAGVHPWVQLRRNSRSAGPKILGATLDSNFDLGSLKWDGTTLTGTAGAFTTATTVTTYESFEIEFQRFGDPTEFTSEVEFTGTSDPQNWAQIAWSINSAWTIGSVSVTLQLYNYTLGSHPTSGNGLMSYTSSDTANTDEIQSQTITQNPNQFRNATGYWKIKVKGVKATSTRFDLKVDSVMFDPSAVGSSRLDLKGTFTIDLSTYPLAYIRTVEIRLRYKASDAGENWYLKAYNWTALAYSDNGFNTTAGHTPTTGWDNYAVNLTSSWQSYVSNTGTMYVKFLDNGPDTTNTVIDIDFLGVRAKIDGTNFTFKNQGSMTSHLVSLWVINSTNHRRYDLDIFVNSADTFSYIRADISLPSGQYFVKVITERGNTAVYPAG